MDGKQTNNQSEASPTEQKETSQALFNYLRWLRDEESAIETSYQEKINRFITLEIVLFVGISYAISQAGWARGMFIYPIVALGLLSTCLVFRGFYCCIRCMRIIDTSVMGVSRLKGLVEEGDIKRLTVADLNDDLSINTINAIQENRSRVNERRTLSLTANRAIICDTVAVGLLVLFSVGGNVLTKDKEECKKPIATAKINQGSEPQQDRCTRST